MNNRQKSQNDTAWETLFSKYDILNQVQQSGQYVISAAAIKEYREPRLMAKFDHRVNLPEIFDKNNLAILPISRGDYIISHYNVYYPFENPEQTVTQATLPAHLLSLNPRSVPSEAIAINCALAAGMFADFLGEETLHSTVSGRMGSGQFGFDIYHTVKKEKVHVDVANSQIEIDAAFEGKYSLSLLEAKRELAEDFLVRQLYYPYRVWQNRISKKVRPIFLVYSNGIYRLYEYEFQNPDYYNSLVLLKHKNYSIEDTRIEMQDLIDVSRQITGFVPEPKLPFPQADSFERVINLCELLESQELSREQVTEEYAFNIRQTNYYSDAGRYLGLIEKSKNGRKPFYVLSSTGKEIMRLNYRQRQLAFCRIILHHKVFYETFRLCLAGTVPDRHSIAAIMKQSDLYQIGSDSTYIRRASTISGWLNWMLKLTKKR